MNKTEKISFRVNQEEKQLILSRANASKINTSTLLRTMTVSKIKSDKELDNLLFNKKYNH